MHSLRVKRGHTQRSEAAAAIQDLHEQIGQPDARLTIVFASPDYDLTALGAAILHHFPGPVLACTTAGEVSSSAGYAAGGLVGATLASDDLEVRTHFLPSLRAFVAAGARLPDAFVAPPTDDRQRFALALLDGIAKLEEVVVAMVHSQLGNTPLVGGSAGDGLGFGTTYVYDEGAFHAGAGIIARVDTTLPFSTFAVQHFVPTEQRLVITRADVETRTVHEINGEPAAEEYARLVGVPRDRLDNEVFAARPLALRLGDRVFLRSVQAVLPDDSLTFYCAIDSGLVLTLASPGDLVSGLRDRLETATADVRGVGLVLGFDCVLRRLELEQTGQTSAACAVLARYPFLGFSTYGEQFNGLHMSQTLTGLCLGGADVAHG